MSTDQPKQRWPPRHLRCYLFTGLRIPIGRPLANARIYLLDGDEDPVPIGVAGELHIGGAGVARGYLNRPELTAERFLLDPFCSKANARMYRTGGLARWVPDGHLEFLGRADFQVKIRGFRIELGEVEAVLRSADGIRDAVLLASEDVPGEKRLVAYVITEIAAATPAIDELPSRLKAHLQNTLPGYMVPAAFVVLKALPLTPNGNLDRKALPAPEAEAYASLAYVPRKGRWRGSWGRSGLSCCASIVSAVTTTSSPLAAIRCWPCVCSAAWRKPLESACRWVLCSSDPPWPAWPRR